MLKGEKMTKSIDIKLNDVRLSFPSIFNKKEWDQGNEPEYEAIFMLDKKKNTKEIKAINDRIDAILAERKISRDKIKEDKICLKDGDQHKREEYQGHYIIKGTSKLKVPLFDQKLNLVSEPQSDILYAGCYVNACIRLYFYDNKFGRGISANLKSIQHKRAGEPFGDEPHDAMSFYEEEEQYFAE